MKQTIINRMYVDMISGLKMSNKEYSERYRVPQGTIRAYRNIAQMLFNMYKVDEAEMKEKDRSIKLLRDVIEQMDKQQDTIMHYSIIGWFIASTIIYLIVLTYVLH